MLDVQTVVQNTNSRSAFGEALLRVAEEMDNIAVVTADLKASTKVAGFAEKYPDRFYNTGIAEQSMISFAGGYAKQGFVVFATAFASFAVFRPYEQIRLDVCYQDANVKIIGAGSGIGLGTQGNTHFAMEDIAALRAMPNLSILSPSDNLCVYKAVEAAAKTHGPVYIRLTGEGCNPQVYHADFDFAIGASQTLREGGDVCILATGRMVYEALQAASLLEAEGCHASVVDMYSIKPIDRAALEKACACKLVVTVEEHSTIGGLGGAVAECITEYENAPRLLRIGLPDLFGKTGLYEEQLVRYGLSGEQIARKIRQAAGLGG